MMLCVKQMSSERVAACLNHWKTPRELHEWLREQERLAAAQEDDPSRSSVASPAKGRKKIRGIDMIFADTVQGEGRQKIGDQMSRDVSIPSNMREAGSRADISILIAIQDIRAIHLVSAVVSCTKATC